MSVYKLFLDELAEFKKAYFGNLSERIATIKINYLKALNVLGLESTADGGFIEIEDALRKVENLVDLGTKIKNIKKLGSRVQREMLQAGNARELTDDNVTRES